LLAPPDVKSWIKPWLGGLQLPYQKSQEISAAGSHPFGPSTTTRNKNLAIANRSRVSCAHNTLTASICITLKSRLRVTQGQSSLKLVPFESLGAVSYSPSIVTMAASLAISEIFSVKEWPDLGIWVWGCSRSLKMVRFDRTCMTFY